VQFYVFPRASPSGIHKTTLRVQITYTLESHGTTITYTMMITSSHRRTGEHIIWHIPLLSQHICHLRGIYADHTLPPSQTRKANDIAQSIPSEKHFDGAFLVAKVVLLLCHDVNMRTAHTVDFCVFFTTVGSLAASISSLEIVASKMLLYFLWV